VPNGTSRRIYDYGNPNFMPILVHEFLSYTIPFLWEGGDFATYIFGYIAMFETKFNFVDFTFSLPEWIVQRSG
jgi:hypothetical protein